MDPKALAFGSVFFGAREVRMATIVLCVVTFLASIVFSMMGLGGGAVYTPIQVWVGIDFHVAAATSLFLIMVTSLSATIIYHKASKIDWPLALVLESVTILGGFIGGYYSDLVSTKSLSLIFSIVVGCIGLCMIRDIKPRMNSNPDHWYIWKRSRFCEEYFINVPLAMTIGIVAGVFSGLLGVGGGILKVPLLVMLLGVPMHIAVGTSACMVGITALGGFSGHYLRGHFDITTALMLALFVFIGSQIGSRKSLTTDKNKLRKACGWLLIIIALTMLLT